jgi:DNA-binding NtrC family response regulator
LQLRLDVSEERNQELQKELRKVLRQDGNSERSRPALDKRGKADRNNKPAPVVALVPKPPVEEGKALDSLVAEFEARMIEQTLARCGGNQSQAARLLGLRPNTLHYKIERYGLADKKNPERSED